MAKKVETVESSASDKVKAALALLNKTFGDGSAMTFNNVEVKKIPAISTGSISLDLALGIGGLPLGRCCEIIWKVYNLYARVRRSSEAGLCSSIYGLREYI